MVVTSLSPGPAHATVPLFSSATQIIALHIVKLVGLSWVGGRGSKKVAMSGLRNNKPLKLLLLVQKKKKKKTGYGRPSNVAVCEFAM